MLRETAVWLSSIADPLKSKLVAVGLIEKQESTIIRLGDFLEKLIESRTDLKQRTVIKYRDTSNKLISYFGSEKPIEEINPIDGDEFRRWLQTNLGDNTVCRCCGRAREFSRYAVRKRLLSTNPFAEMKRLNVQPNRSRDYFLSIEDAAKILDACPNAQWRLIFVLSRFGGLRCPSEHLELTWDDVDWEKNRLRVRSPKTEHFEGKGERIIPMFPEIRTELEMVFEQAEPGAVYVITDYRSTNQNLRTQFTRIIRRAGLVPWEKLFQNLRASCATELVKEHPQHVASAWFLVRSEYFRHL
ncbi:MAG: tyrosine-type recombinase/integrase [Zavarzinella sp.]